MSKDNKDEPKIIVIINLPETQAGDGIRGQIFVETTDVKAVKNALEGKHLGVMGCELSDSDFKMRKLYTLEQLQTTPNVNKIAQTINWD